MSISSLLKPSYASACAVVTAGVLCLTATATLAAPVVVYQESFDGAGDGFTTVGQGSNNGDFWDVTAIPGTLNLLYTPGGNDGNVFGGRDLDTNFGGQSGSNALRRLATNPVDVSGLTNPTIDIALSARPGNRYEGSDFLSILVDDGTGGGFVEIDRFVGGPGSTPLTSLTNGALGGTLNTFTYDISPGATNVSVAVRTFVNGSGETLALDDIVIRGEVVPLPAAGWVGMITLSGLGLIKHVRHRRAIS